MMWLVAADLVSCYLTLQYTEAGDASEGYRLLDEAGVQEGIDMLVLPPVFTMRVTGMERDRLDVLISALEATGANVTEAPDEGPLVREPGAE